MLWFDHCAAWNALSQPFPGTGCGFITGESRQALFWWERVRDASECSWGDPAGTAPCLPGTAGHGGSLPTGGGGQAPCLWYPEPLTIGFMLSRTEGTSGGIPMHFPILPLFPLLPAGPEHPHFNLPLKASGAHLWEVTGVK